MPLAARRTFRLAAVMALSLALAYGFAMPLPFLAPLFAIFLTSTPAPPMGPKSLLGLLLVVTITLGTGLVLTPILRNYPWTGVMLVATGLFVSTYLSVGMGQGLVSTLLTIGLTMIPAAALVEHAVARSVVQALLIGIAMAIACQWVVYPFVPEDARAAAPAKAPKADAPQAAWLALRTMLIVLPPVLMAFTNPSMYMAIIMKAVMLGQQGSAISARAAGKELLGSTFLAGVFAMALWFALQAWPSLWMFFLWMLLFGLYLGAKLYGVSSTRFPPSFWVNVGATMLILIGPAVQDSTGGDVRSAFAVRFVLFVAVTVYAWVAILVLERWREGRVARVATRT
ncbi:DUF2955 domain-containing protein [Lysobacter sp. KIS68-7]|uniref:DUF2955 domain-containing protein n=1 Tax=Lysobacter sp. KIS68-7 TaxID=2904252 RepID=UPI001E4374CE|nr:DUF2955 domain-containing protein [Lysobacter sp. KIS68-7]UHQ19542.1 DUF2955 domain-containing protein [Lysobacter sp. KIS68-7]